MVQFLIPISDISAYPSDKWVPLYGGEVFPNLYQSISNFLPDALFGYPGASIYECKISSPALPLESSGHISFEVSG